MSNVPTTSLPPGQADRLARLLDALDGVVISDAERASLTWLAGFEASTVENIAARLHGGTEGDLRPGMTLLVDLSPEALQDPLGLSLVGGRQDGVSQM